MRYTIEEMNEIDAAFEDRDAARANARRLRAALTVAAIEIERLESIIKEMDQCGLSRQAAEVLHPKSQ